MDNEEHILPNSIVYIRCDKMNINSDFVVLKADNIYRFLYLIDGSFSELFTVLEENKDEKIPVSGMKNFIATTVKEKLQKEIKEEEIIVNIKGKINGLILTEKSSKKAFFLFSKEEHDEFEDSIRRENNGNTKTD